MKSVFCERCIIGGLDDSRLLLLLRVFSPKDWRSLRRMKLVPIRHGHTRKNITHQKASISRNYMVRDGITMGWNVELPPRQWLHKEISSLDGSRARSTVAKDPGRKWVAKVGSLARIFNSTVSQPTFISSLTRPPFLSYILCCEYKISRCRRLWVLHDMT